MSDTAELFALSLDLEDRINDIRLYAKLWAEQTITSDKAMEKIAEVLLRKDPEVVK